MYKGPLFLSYKIYNHIYCIKWYKIETKNVKNGDKRNSHISSNLRVICIKIKVEWPRYRPGVAQRVGRGIALLFHDRSTRRGWVVSSTPRPHFTPGKDPVPILQEAGWAPGPAWTGGKSLPHRDSIPDRPARSQSLYRLIYPVHRMIYIPTNNDGYTVTKTFTSLHFSTLQPTTHDYVYLSPSATPCNSCAH